MRNIDEYFNNAEKYQDQPIKFNRITHFSKISLYTSNDGVCNDLIMLKMLLNTSGRSPAHVRDKMNCGQNGIQSRSVSSAAFSSIFE